MSFSTYLSSKIHNALVTDVRQGYQGSISICPELLQHSRIREYQQVHVWNITNGFRFVTYAIEAENIGDIVINGAAAHNCNKEDRIIIATFDILESFEITSHLPRIVIINEDNSSYYLK